MDTLTNQGKWLLNDCTVGGGMGKRTPELFLKGLFSMIDAFLDRPLEEILTKLPIVEDIKKGLLGEQNQVRDVFELVVAFEKWDWSNFTNYATRLALDQIELLEIFVQALERANQNLSVYQLTNKAVG